jgi:simple sugar transport system permease protein
VRISKTQIPVIAATFVFLLVIALASMKYSTQHFLSLGTFSNLIKDSSFIGVTAIGVTFVIISGGIDLSVGAMIGFSSILLATLIRTGMNPVLAIPIVLAIGVLFGMFMGSIIAFFDLPPFLVTLAGMFLARGLGFVISQEALDIKSSLFERIGDFGYGEPLAFLFVVLLGALILHFLPFGRSVYAIGGSESSALLMGLPVRKTKISIYAISGFCSALGGIVYAFYTTSGKADAGMGLELDAIAAVVIGGTLLSGGVGYVFGTVVGVLTLGIIQTILSYEPNLSSWWTKIIIGALLCMFILLQKAVRVKESRA